MMDIQKKIIKQIKKANIDEADWVEDVRDTISESYALGYFDGKLSEIYNSLSSSTEDFREELLEVVKHDIWGKS